ncbi:glutamate 5-kinase [Thalassotalea maritima]|uniref:glutamate 5-kinase n=1 Tax=Thalassotalea maritima TaxID=3242416 RepID=UPI003528AFDD
MSLRDKKRIVIKVGSALIAPQSNGCSTKYLKNIAQFVLRCRANGQDVVIVSSGSVAAGKQWFRDKRPQQGLKKAMAATGQTEMMAMWDKLLNVPLAQLLLTHADFNDRERYMSIQDTIESILAGGVVPVVNENDTVSCERIKVGDNDNLAAMTAAATKADALIMCTDVDGLFDKNPQHFADAKLIDTVAEIDPHIWSMAGDSSSDVGTGGMHTKLQAADKATAHGIDTYIVNGFNSISFYSLLQGVNPGTLFKGKSAPMSPAQHWLTHTVKHRGEVIISNDKSPIAGDDEQLTSDDIVDVNGQFSVGDTILLKSDDGTCLAKAKTKFSSCLLKFLKKEQGNLSSADIHVQKTSIIHNEHIAVLEK